MLIRVQGQPLRTLAVNEDESPGGERLKRLLRQTLSPLRERNDWDRRVMIRVADEVAWRDLISLMDSLAAERFDAVALTHIEDGLRP